MSAETRVAARYAKSLLSLASEQDKVEQLYQDISFFKNTCDTSRDLKKLLKNPIVNSHKKQAVLKQLLTGRVDDLLLRFVQVVCRKGRESLLYPISEAFIVLYQEIKGIQTATLITASPVEDDQRDQFIYTLTRLTGKQILLTEKTDATLIGGFILKSGDRQMDASVKKKLQQIRLSLSKQ